MVYGYKENNIFYSKNMAQGEDLHLCLEHLKLFNV